MRGDSFEVEPHQIRQYYSEKGKEYKSILGAIRHVSWVCNKFNKKEKVLLESFSVYEWKIGTPDNQGYVETHRIKDLFFYYDLKQLFIKEKISKKETDIIQENLLLIHKFFPIKYKVNFKRVEKNV